MDISHGLRRERYCSGDEDPEAPKQPHFTPSSSSSSNCWIDPSGHSVTEQTAATLVEREHMFNKVVTPSDVGKLNRLVIPKQHAQRYFPLDPASGDKGLLLCFEEGVTGKPWRFRYSYWNSSQSYVMTKGWSRFVKEKRLDAGDTVSFARGVGAAGRGRLFIDWIRRTPDISHHHPIPPGHPMMPLRSVVVPWAGGRPFASPPMSMYGGSSSGGQYLYYRTTPPAGQQLGSGGDGTVGLPIVLDSVPVVLRKAEPKRRLRLFGVNLECSEQAEDHQRVMQPEPQPVSQQLGLGPPRSEFRSSMEFNFQFKGNQEY